MLDGLQNIIGSGEDIYRQKGIKLRALVWVFFNTDET